MKRADKVKVYASWFYEHGEVKVVRRKEWRWTRRAPNGEVVSASTEGYRKKADCVANARRCQTYCPIR